MLIKWHITCGSPRTRLECGQFAAVLIMVALVISAARAEISPQDRPASAPPCEMSPIVVPEIVPAFGNEQCRSSKYLRDFPDLRTYGLQSLTFQFDRESVVFRGKPATVVSASQMILLDAEWVKAKYQKLVSDNISDGCDSISASDYRYQANADGTAEASVQVDYQKNTCTKSTCLTGWHKFPPYPEFSACDFKTNVPGASAKVRIHTTLSPALVPDETGLQKVEVHSSNTVEKLEGPSNLMLNVVGVLTLGIGSKAIQDETNHQIGNLAEDLPSPTIGLAKLPKLRKVDPQVTFTLDTPKFFMDQGRLKFAVSSFTKQTEAVACDVRKQAVQAQRFFQSCASPINQYQVVDGDNLWRVAEKLYGDGQYYHVIANANNLTVGERDNLRPGTTLATPPFYQIASDNNVLVESGDSLWKIAEKQLGDGRRFNELRGLNGAVLDPESLPVLESVQVPTSTHR